MNMNMNMNMNEKASVSKDLDAKHIKCSGVHWSLGVHISKVRSATLDTWLPEQVSFMQFMGNDKSNSYWEAELPSDYVGVGTESFIRAKYEEKRWLSKEGTQTPPEGGEEKYSTFKNGSDDEGSVGCSNNSNKTSLEVAIPAKHLPFLSSGTTPTEPYQGSMDMKVPKL
ncbi:hypothetical protein AAC387_Pa11g1586 [Persea americana]